MAGSAVSAVAVNSCGFWASIFSLFIAMGIPVDAVPDSVLWVKQTLNRLQKEYREGGLKSQTVAEQLGHMDLPTELDQGFENSVSVCTHNWPQSAQQTIANNNKTRV